MYSIEDLDLVAGTIKGKNIKEVPTSDTFIKELVSITGLLESDIKEILEKLKDMNEIFTMEVVKEDRQNKVPAVVGYVVANKSIIKNLIKIYDRKLERIYAGVRKIPKSATQILREPSSYDPSLNNTPLGKAINICNMLRMFLGAMEKNPSRYSMARIREKRKELERELLEKRKSAQKSEQEEEEVEDIRAITKKYYDIAEEEYKKKVSLPKWRNYRYALNQYGFKNLMTYYIRAGRFDVIERLIKEGLIFRKDELEFILHKIEEQRNRVFSKMKDNLIERAKIRKVYDFFKKIVDEKISLLDKDIIVTEKQKIRG